MEEKNDEIDHVIGTFKSVVSIKNLGNITEKQNTFSSALLHVNRKIKYYYVYVLERQNEVSVTHSEAVSTGALILGTWHNLLGSHKHLIFAMIL